MRTRSSSNLVVESYTIPKRRNRRLSKQIVEPELRSIIETPVATMADTHTISELLQAPTEGYGDAIIIPAILAENFELKVELLSLVTSSQFYGFEKDGPHSHIHWFNKITSMLNEAWDRFKDLLRKCPHHDFLELHQIDTFYNALTQSDQDSLNAAAGENLLNLSTTTSSPSPSPDVTALTEIVKELVLMNKATQQATVKAIKETCVICGGPHPYYKCLAAGGNTFDACTAVGTYNQGGNKYRPQGDPNYRASNQMGPPGFPPPNVQNSQNYNQNQYNQNQGNYQAPNNQEFNQQRGHNFNQGNNHYRAPNYQAPNNQAQVRPSNKLSNYMKSNEATLRAMQTQISNMKGKVPQIPTTSSPLPKEVEGEPEATKDKLGECLALADPGASINLMPLSVWKKLSLPELTPTRMTLELANRSIAYPVGVAEDVFVKVGKFHFLADFVVVDYDVDPRVPLILGRPFLRTAQALIDVHGEELILRDGDEQLIFHVDNTSKHPNKHESINMINFIDITCEDRFSEVLKFKKSNHPSSGSTTPLSDSLLEEFADELVLLDPFPPGNKDDNFNPEADLREIEYLLNRDPSTKSSPKSDIEIIDPILERFTDEPAYVYSPPPGDDNDDNDDLFMISLLVLPTMEPEDSLIMGDEDLHSITEKESNEFIKSSVEDLVPIPSESEDTSDSDKECDLHFCDNPVTFSNPLFDSNNDFTSSDDESLPEEDDQEENFKIYSNPLFEFDDEYISITSLPDDNEDGCFDPGGDMDEIDAFLGIDVSTDIEDGYHDSERDIIYLESLLINDTIPNLPPEVFFDHDPRSLKDEPDNDNLKSMVKVFDPGIHEKIISPTYVRLPFEDRHYFSLTFVIKIFLPFLTYLVNSLPFLSSGSGDLIFDPGISCF
ncbi:reverse transcriptase domain-containing protein [Tanacetum coccineum]